MSDGTGKGWAIQLDSLDYLLVAAEAASDKKAENIVALDVAELLVVTDSFLICTGRTDRQVRTIADEIELKVKQAGLPPMGIEGHAEGRWVLIDFGDLVAHVFQPEEREFYRLERLWADAPRIGLPKSVTGPAEGILETEPARS